MPPQINFSRETIVNTAFEIVREHGLQGISARNVARRLNSSTQPLYREFESIQQLEHAVLKKIKEYTVAYMLRGDEAEGPFLSIGLRYVQFAREEKELFKLLYMSENHGESFQAITGPFHQLLNRMKTDPHLQGLDEACLPGILQKMAIFTHGLTTLVWANSIPYSEERIRDLLYEMGRVVIEWEYYRQQKTQEDECRGIE